MRQNAVTLSIACLLLLPVLAPAQPFRLKHEPTVPVRYGADTLANPWTGGLNAPQFSSLHVNGDDVADLVVFDRSTDHLTVYVASTRGNGYFYRFAPEYASLFPPLKNWVLLADYDGDGRNDLFTSTEGGIKVYRNAPAGDGLRWEMVSEQLQTVGYSGDVNLYVSATDIPALTDVDNDGDLDVLTADPTGHSVEWHQNLSREKYGHARTLEFRRVTTCWGKFEIEEGCDGYVLDAPCEERGSPGGRIKHTGLSLLAMDLDGNGLKDLLVGSVSCDKITGLLNGGTATDARITGVLTDFPASNPARVNAFPAAFYEDVDFDGKQDLLIAPNVTLNEGDRIDFRQTAWWYANTGTAGSPAFTFRQPDFLQNSTLDLGDQSAPTLGDYDGDGDLDLLVGHQGNPVNGQLGASLVLFENVGTARNPAFRLATDDYLALAGKGWSHLKPQFTDLNGDRVPDLVLTNTFNNGLNTDVKYWINAASRRQAFRFQPAEVRTLPINLRIGDTPFLQDLDGDGDADLLMGRNLGELEYYQNTGSRTNAAFTLASPAFGGIPTDPFERSTAPLVADMDGNGKPDLVTGNRRGMLRIFANLTLSPNAVFSADTSIIADSLSGQFTDARLGGTLTLAAGDLTRDGLPDLVIGSAAGGLVLLRNVSNGGRPLPGPGNGPAAWLYPNPASRYLYITPRETGEVSFYNALGQQMNNATYPVAADRETAIELPPWPAGLYFARLRSASGMLVERFVVVR
jgi:hypothetical protein